MFWREADHTSVISLGQKMAEFDRGKKYQEQEETFVFAVEPVA